MVKYHFELRVEGEQSEEIFIYGLDLTAHQEDNVDEFFSNQVCEAMRSALQEKSSCRISNTQLDRMIQAWKEDISEGYRTTTMMLTLTSVFEEQLGELRENGNQQKPQLLPPELLTMEPMFGVMPPLIFL